MDANSAELTVGQIGERKLIERLSVLLISVESDIPLGIGDDCAVVNVSEAPWRRQVMTTDMLAEGTHFVEVERADMCLVGHKAMTSNISDIAAMGGKPQYALVSLAVPKETKVSKVEDLYRGMASEAAEFGVSIIGGDTIGVGDGHGIVLSITLTGVCRDDIPIPMRKSAQPGQNVYVTGRLGGSRAGMLFLIDSQFASAFPDATIAETLVHRHLAPKARVSAGAVIAGLCDDLAMIDISDSLMNELGLICQASSVCAELSAPQLPVFDGVAAVAQFRHESVEDFALYSGEEYELLFCTKVCETELRSELDRAGLQGLALSRIGTIVARDDSREGPVRVLDADGRCLPLDDLTFKHF